MTLANLKRALAAAIAFVWVAVTLIFDLPLVPMGEKLDRSKFEEIPTFADEFDGDTMDPAKWNPNFHQYNVVFEQRGGWWHSDMVEVKDGALRINTAYKPEGIGGGPAGFYSSGIDAQYKFEQTYGYFEARCKLPRGGGKWAAFWLRSHGAGPVGDDIEIDIMEAPNFAKTGMNHQSIVHNIHKYSNWEHQGGKKIAKTFVKNPYDEFHTYGVEWNEKEIIFYVDGVESARRDTEGLAVKDVYPMFTVEIGGENSIPGESWVGAAIQDDENLPSSFVVDYVRAYQYKK